jgi:hypothetical protein
VPQPVGKPLGIHQSTRIADASMRSRALG